MIGGEINYLIGNIFVDILLADKIIVEYDCWHWHKDVLTKDRRRDEFLKSRGYKILRIKSSHLIPTLEQINLRDLQRVVPVAVTRGALRADDWVVTMTLDDLIGIARRLGVDPSGETSDAPCFVADVLRDAVVRGQRAGEHREGGG